MRAFVGGGKIKGGGVAPDGLPAVELGFLNSDVYISSHCAHLWASCMLLQGSQRQSTK
jgi:hypothetical protein